MRVKIMFFGHGYVQHLNPTIQIARLLISEGYKIKYCAPSAAKDQLLKLGCEFASIPIYEQAGNTVINEIYKWKEKPYQSIEEAVGTMVSKIKEELACCQSILNEITAYNPDLIIYDGFHYAVKTAARYANKPAISSVPGFAYHKSMMTKAPEFVLKDILNVKLQEHESIEAGMRQFQVLSKVAKTNLNLKNLDLIDDCYVNTNQLNFIYTHKCFQPYHELFDEHRYLFVGPCMSYNTNRQVCKKKVIYVSFGKIAYNDPLLIKTYQCCINALRKYRLYIYDADDAHHSFDNVSEDTVISSTISQKEILNRADLFITHGGLNSVHDGIMSGVPMIVIPQKFDNFLVAKQIAKHGIGIVLDTNDVTEKTLSQAAQQALEDISIHKKIRRMSSMFHTSGGAGQAVSAIKQYLN